jgi:predicted MFS family arabinose efflux permease
MATPSISRANYGRLLRNSGYLRVFSAGAASVAGSAISGVCIIWVVFTSTGSALAVGLLGTAWLAAGILLTVFTGTIVDRYDRRRLMILSDLVRAATLAVVVFELRYRGFDFVTLLAANFSLSAFTTLFNPAEQALLPSLVEPEQIADANGLVQSSRSALVFVGASVAGLLLLSVGPVIGIAVNSATFLASALLLQGMTPSKRSMGQAGAPVERRTYLSDIRTGFRWLWNHQGFFQLTISATVFNFCSAIVATFLVVFAATVLQGTALTYALLLAVEVAGSGLGAILVGRLHAVRWAGRAWVVPYGCMAGATVVALALFPGFAVAMVALFAFGTFSGFSGTAWLSAAQLLVPSRVQGRYFGIDQLGSIAILPAAQIGGALLIQSYGAQTTYLVAGVAWLIAGIAFLFPAALASLGYPEAGSAGEGVRVELEPGPSGSPLMESPRLIR